RAGQAGLLGGEAAEGKQHERGQGQLLVTKDKDEITPAVRNTATSTARAVTVRGCRKA
ncbi:unnamed protein product, partial [Scytosiphon promiscuus]